MHVSAHTALHSGAAHRHGNVRVARSDGAPAVVREKIRIAGRIPPLELTLGAGDEPPQRDSTQMTATAAAEQHPGFCRAIRRTPDAGRRTATRPGPGPAPTRTRTRTPDHVASLRCISLIIKGLHLSGGQLIRRTSLSNCAPSPCGRISRPPTTTSAPPVHRASGTHSLHIANGPSPVHMPDSSALAGLPVAVFILACRKSMQRLLASDALRAAPEPPPYLYDGSS